jgi:hypothetical protein
MIRRRVVSTQLNLTTTKTKSSTQVFALPTFPDTQLSFSPPRFHPSIHRRRSVPSIHPAPRISHRRQGRCVGAPPPVGRAAPTDEGAALGSAPSGRHCLGRAYGRLRHGQRPRAGGGEDLGDAAVKLGGAPAGASAAGVHGDLLPVTSWTTSLSCRGRRRP